MSRIAATFQRLAGQGRKALIPFITAGDPDPGFTVPMLHGLVAAGADIIELGVPFSDPMADGPVIQRASERALAHKMSLRKTLALVAQFRQQDTRTPLVLMGYLNPVEAMGYAAFADAAAQVGVDGALTVDLPPEEAGPLVALLKARGIDPIFLIAPNSGEERIAALAAAGAGYLYYVSLKGVTGADHLDAAEVALRLKAIKAITRLPVAVGFGVKDAPTASAVAGLGDGVVVGSALVSKIEAHGGDPGQARAAIAELTATLRLAIDNGACR